LENTSGIKKIESNSHKMTNFILTKDIEAWAACHKKRLQTVGDLETLIKKEKNNLYVKKDEFMR
jgi:hypothetical protein